MFEIVIVIWLTWLTVAGIVAYCMRYEGFKEELKGHAARLFLILKDDFAHPWVENELTALTERVRFLENEWICRIGKTASKKKTTRSKAKKKTVRKAKKKKA